MAGWLLYDLVKFDSCAQGPMVSSCTRPEQGNQAELPQIDGRGVLAFQASAVDTCNNRVMHGRFNAPRSKASCRSIVCDSFANRCGVRIAQQPKVKRHERSIIGTGRSDNLSFAVAAASAEPA